MPNIKYMVNDPIAPVTLNISMPNPPTDPKFQVTGYIGVGAKTPLQLQSLNTYVTMSTIIASRQKALARSGFQFKKWAATPSLSVSTRAGEDLNAYYDRRGLKFFYYTNKNSVLYTVDSTDVVTHEFGHALLDSIKPDFWSVNAAEIWAFHEAWSDISAILYMMEFPQVIEAAIKENNGNLRKSNLISRLAEQLGAAIYGKGHLFLRNAINSFKYQDPKTLPSDAPDDQLSSECHSFGQVFLATWYDIMVQIYEQECKRVDAPSALTIAKNVAAEYLYKAVVQSPRVAKYHYAIAKGMLLADQVNGSKYSSILRTVFKNRNMLPPEIKVLANLKKRDIKVKEEDVVIKRGKVTSVVVKNNKAVKLGEFHSKKTLSALSVGGINLADVKIEVPFDNYYEFDEKGQLQDQILPIEEEVIEDARLCALNISMNENVGKGKMWRISRNKLTRTFFQ